MAETHTERDASLPRYPAGILPHIIGERLSGYWVVRVPDKIVHGHDGIFDLPAILQALLDVKYAHHVGLEYEKDMGDPLPGLAESIGYLHGLLKTMKPA